MHATERRSESVSATADAVSPVADAGLAILEAAGPTRGLGLAFRASAALAHGAHTEASELIAAALGASAHPEYFAMAVELALAEGDTTRALGFAARGFRATQDDSDVCLAFAAAIVRAERGPVSVEGWDVWRNAHASTWATRLFTAALTAIRAGRDHTAILLLEGALEAGTIEPVLSAQALYHLDRRLSDARETKTPGCAFAPGRGRPSTLLPPPVQAALHFHLGELDLQDNRPASSIEHFEAC